MVRADNDITRSAQIAHGAGLLIRLLAPGLTLFILALWSLSAEAQWTDVGSQRAVTEREAVVRSDSLAELRIWLDDEQSVHLQFKLTPGLVSLAPDGCLTLQVDDQPMQDLSAPKHECSSDGESVRMLLTQVEEKQLDSPTLLDLMNGKSVNLRYRLLHAGYGTEQFSLKGSKQALRDALGTDIKIVGD